MVIAHRPRVSAGATGFGGMLTADLGQRPGTRLRLLELVEWWVRNWALSPIANTQPGILPCPLCCHWLSGGPDKERQLPQQCPASRKNNP